MPVLDDETINKQLGAVTPIQPIPASNPMISQVETITNNIKSILEMIMSARNKTQEQPFQQQPPKQITMATQQKIDEGKLRTIIDDKLKLLNLLPKEVKSKTISEFVEEYKTNEATKKIVIDFLVKTFNQAL